MAIKFLSGQTISGTLTVSGNVQGATFNGLAINTTGTNNVANQIVRTQANGYVNFGWINSVSGNHTGAITRITASNDAYLRYVTPAQFRTGVTDGFYAPSSTVSGVTSVGGTGTVSGITLSGTVTSTGNLTLGGTLSASITNISNASNWWNNFGDVHGTRTGFDASTASYSFGWRYVQGNTNGPGTGGTQFYSAYVGLGSQYPATGSGSYGAYLAFDRNVANPYLSIRYNEANVLGTWKKISAGTADILTTARTIAGVSFNGSANISLNNNAITNGAGYTTNTGTVTSVAAGNGLAGGTITTTGTLSTVHLPSFDTRNSNPDPEDYANLIRFDFKRNSTNGLSDGGTYNGQMTWRSYGSGSDMSGGLPIRLAYTASGNLWRQMGTSATAWGDWNKFALATGTSSQYIRGDGSIATFPTITGGTVTSVNYTHQGNAFTVGGVPVTSSGTIAVTMAGSSSQYINGAGNLISFPTIPPDPTGVYLPLAGGIMSGNIGRSAYNSGYQVGGYNNIGASHAKTNPIHVIGTSYEPTATALSNMYGIGYTRADISFMGVAQGSGWGLYVASDGDARIFLDGSQGDIYATNKLCVNSYANQAGGLLFSAGQTTGTTRSLNLRTSSPTGDPSSSDQGASTGITWGQRTDSSPYYIIYPKLENWNSSGNYSKLTLAWHTGIKIGADKAYGGTRFYNQSPDIAGASIIMNVGVGSDEINIVKNLQVTGSMYQDVSSIGGYIVKPKGADFFTAASQQTGAIEIRFPTGGATRNDMVFFTVDVYQYTTNRSFSIKAGGYIYQSIGSNTWVNVFAQVYAKNSNQNYTIRFGDNGSTHCMWIGESTDSWSYSQIVVRDFFGGYATDINQYKEGWDITFDSLSGKTINNTLTNNFPLAQDIISGAYLPLAGGTMSGDIQMLSNTLRFDQSGTRSWAMNAASGNLFINSGDGLGSVSLNCGLIVADTLTANSTLFLKDRITLPASALSSVSGRPVYAIYQEGGAWTNPYPDLCIAMHTGIKFGANASYNGMRFYDDYTMATQVMSVNNSADALGGGNVYVNNSLQAGSSLRAPIFYDSNNTAYYTNPNGFSSLWGVAIRGDNDADGTENQIFFYGSGGTTTSAIGFKNGGSFANPTGNGDGWNTMLTMDTDGRGWVFRRGTGGTNFTSAYTAGWILNNGIFQANASMRAPIFYDSNNTAYFGDFGGTYSNITKLKINANWGSASGVSPDDAQLQIRGNYPSITFRSVNSNKMWLRHMDSAGQIQHYYAAGTDSTSWSIKHTMQIDGTFISQGSMRAPIFYDSNNTAYYGDFASTSQLNVLNCAGTLTVTGAGGVIAPKFTDYNNGSFYLDPSSTGTSLNVAGDVVAYASSDIRFKNNITPITNALDKLSKIGGYTFEWNEISHKETGKKDIGVVAQEVEEILPEIVQTRSNGYKAVDYQKLTALLIESVKEQQVIINDLKTRIETLENN